MLENDAVSFTTYNLHTEKSVNIHYVLRVGSSFLGVLCGKIRGSVTKGVVPMEKTLEITLPAEIEEKARARAEREGVTLAEAVRRLLEEYAVDNSNLLHVPMTPVKLTQEQIDANIAALDAIEKEAEELRKYLPEQIDVRDLLNEMRR